MRAVTISAHGGVEQLELRDDLPVPEPGQGEVRVRLGAAALNHLDVFTIGGLPGITIRPPWILGADGAGDIDAVGSGVTSVKAGDRVVINPGISDGTCEYCVAGEQSLRRPDRYGLRTEGRLSTERVLGDEPQDTSGDPQDEGR